MRDVVCQVTLRLAERLSAPAQDVPWVRKCGLVHTVVDG